MFADYDEHDALGLAELVKQGQVSAAELLETAIARLEKVNPTLNAVVHTMYAPARAAAERPVAGPFQGVPFLIKDLIQDIAGQPTVGGSRFWRGWVADRDSELVRRYRAAGLIFFGKTNTPENGLMPVTEPEVFGPTRTPWDTGRTSGG
ncbi:MAG TPA: amidase, partial [Polyangiaceae bacterium LLY-WYZ-15_(1-7)]|nr:amidase [Polyangiaceae bacterium LLY-WYZ-15_(1-7)]